IRRDISNLLSSYECCGYYLLLYNRFMPSVSTELSRGVLHAADLRDRLGVSPATLMRMVRDAGQDVVRIGRGRATQYALRQQWLNLDSSRFPLFRITRTGAAVSEWGRSYNLAVAD